MSLLITMLPFYLIGNFHCAGMCGPLVFMLAQHRFRYFYFLGRIASFSLCGWLAGAAGAIINIFLQEYYLSAIVSLIMGVAICCIGLIPFFGGPRFTFFSHFFAKINRSLSILMLKDQIWPTFLFGFFTVFLPCGQSLIVFSACAISGDQWTGLINGFAFAILTSPALIAALHASSYLGWLKSYYTATTALFAVGIGLIAICRGLADLGLISHLVLSEKFHFVIY